MRHPILALALGLACAVAGAAAPALAHDYWLEPAAFQLPVGEPLAVSLRFGDDFKPEKNPMPGKQPVASFERIDARGRKSLLAWARGPELAVNLPLLASGSTLLVLARKPHVYALTAKEFNGYLAEEGLGAIAARRARRHQTGRPARERLTRYAKTLVQVGSAHNGLFARPVGQRLEIVPLDDPYAAPRPAALRVRLLRDGVPLAGNRLSAYNRAPGEATVRTRLLVTAADGTCRVPIDAPGQWLLRALAMRELPRGRGADYESFGTDLAFAAYPEVPQVR